ncbi:MAG: hypothetical protein J6Z31_02755 [Fibrobacter sp.]|nr:hypothetical protein [Fibrobacter sp.]
MRVWWKIFLTVFVLASYASAYEANDPHQEDSFQRYSLVPVLGYTEETKLLFGAMVLFFLKPEEQGGKVPEIGLTAYGSSRGQIQFVLEPYYYFYHDLIHVWFNLKYQDWITSYYGNGNNPDVDRFVNYDKQKFYFGSKWESKAFVPNGFKYGVELHMEHTNIQFRNSDMKIPDPQSGWRNGVGYILGLDTRDNGNWTEHGVLVEWKQLFYTEAIGDYSFDVESLDMRAYTVLPFAFTMATGALWQRSEGDVPFDMLAGPDGVQRFRGVESLYFNDNQALTLQMEVRKFFGWRLGSHVFFEGGKVGDHFSELWRNKWHRSVGVGALLGLNVKERLFARADVSWVDFDHVGLSFYVRQAF